LALTLVGLIYGANYNIAKIVLNGYIPPFAFIAIRVMCATALLWLIHSLIVKEKVTNKKDFILMLKCAVFGVALNQLLFFKGLSLTTSINASIIMTSSPVIVMVMALIILKERIGPFKALGLIVGLSGAFLLIYSDELGFSNDTFLGDLAILGNATSYSLYLVIAKPLMVKYHPLTIVKWLFTFGTFMVLPFGISEIGEVDVASFTPAVWLSIAYVIILSTVVVYWLNALTLGYVSPSVVGIYIYLQPFFATTIAVLFFNEILTLKQVIAAALIFLGVYLVNNFEKLRKRFF
jgi:drug/metabolite transporter (DMT)-like permease